MSRSEVTYESAHSSFYFVFICLILGPPLGMIVFWALSIFPYNLMTGNGFSHLRNTQFLSPFLGLAYTIGIAPAFIYLIFAIAMARKARFKMRWLSLAVARNFMIGVVVYWVLCDVFPQLFMRIFPIIFIPFVFCVILVPAYICTRLGQWWDCFPDTQK